jgi:serine/threonine protein kinase
MGQSCCPAKLNDISPVVAQCKDYDTIYCVGRGGFGKVYKIYHRGLRKFCALKVMRKSKVIRKNGVTTVMNERQLLEVLNHA